MEPARIRERAALEAAIGAERFLLFKHSPVCPISRAAFARYREFAASHPEVPTGWIDVIDQRSWSQWVAAETGVPHESPQAILVEGGRAAWHASHDAITVASLEGALQ